MKRFIVPALPDETSEEEDVYELTHIDHLFIRDRIEIPGFSNYETLKCDFHTHTVFSDGLVWPDARIYEAWQEGLDAIAITDHIEHRINKVILKGDLNESYKIAKKAADDMDFIVIPGAEITRSKPLGHLNALFVQDVNLMEKENPVESIAEAKRQGAFIVWNHPGWPNHKATLYPIHEKLIQENMIDGIEVMSYKDFYPIALEWCSGFKKAFMASSDAHCVLSGIYRKGLRPLTLVFSEERSEKGIREALFAGRTAALFDGKIAGEEKYLAPLVKACIRVKRMRNTCLEVTNISDIPFIIYCENNLYLLPERKTIIMMNPKENSWIMKNCFIGRNKNLLIYFDDFSV